MNRKAGMIIGGTLAAGALALAAFSLFSRDSRVSEYRGMDDAAALKREIATLSQKRTTIVMFHLTTCQYCRRMDEMYHQADGKTKLDYNVLKVEIRNYPKIRTELMKGRYVPESHVHFGAPEPHIFTGVADSLPALVGYMDKVHEWRQKNLSPVPQKSLPAPAP